MLKPSLQLRLGQQLTMTPQLQQAIHLLQLPILDLQSQIHEALESNVMLESEEESRDGANGSDTSTTAEVVAGDESWLRPEMPGIQNRQSSFDPLPIPEFIDHSSEGLQEHLLWQLELEHLSAVDYAIGEALIDAINEDGYLEDDLESLRNCLEPELFVSLSEVEHVLALLQRLDPVGVGARSVSECVCLQLRQLDPDTPNLDLALTLGKECLDEVAEHQYATLRRRLKATEDELDAALALVRSCHPRPGAAMPSSSTEYVIPDVFVRRQDNRWIVDINTSYSPKLRVNQAYAGAIGRGEDHATLRSQLQEARWLIRSLEIRNDTMLKVATCIVEHQKAFLERGDEAMRPMVLRDVAEKVNMHESTISRVTANKYMHTPRGVFEFRHFFSSHLRSADGENRSSTAIRAKIRKIIADEDPLKPLSDNKVAEMLGQDGVRVARRTVAKYREALGIPSSSERKRLARVRS